MFTVAPDPGGLDPVTQLDRLQAELEALRLEVQRLRDLARDQAELLQLGIRCDTCGRDLIRVCPVCGR